MADLFLKGMRGKMYIWTGVCINIYTAAFMYSRETEMCSPQLKPPYHFLFWISYTVTQIDVHLVDFLCTQHLLYMLCCVTPHILV